jgi:hypothetical protein
MADSWGFKLCALDQCEDCRAAIEKWLNVYLTLDELDAIKKALIDNGGKDHANRTVRDSE